jgi:hypothetical protein
MSQSRDSWLFLTPEVEAELPAAVAALAAALDERAEAEREAERVEDLVLQGRYRDWLGYLQERQRLLERYVVRCGSDALAAHVAAVLHEQYLLALAVRGEEERAGAGRERAAALERRLREAGAR